MKSEFKVSDEAIVKKIAGDFSKYCDIDLETKFNPVSVSVENMLTRMEEFQFMLLFAQESYTESEKNINLLLDMRHKFQDIRRKIDRLKDLTTRLTENMNTLEKAIEKEEMDMGIYDTATKVSNMLTPLLFKRSMEDKNTLTEKAVIEAVNVENYFH